MNKLANLFIVTGSILILISSSILVHHNYKEIKTGKESSKTLNIIKDNLSKSNLNTTNVKKNTSTDKMPTTNINGYDYIGTISIPTLNLELPIISECDYDRLELAPCRYYGSIYTNDLIICAHSYKTQFKYISNLKQSDIIIFTDINGHNYIYEVIEIEILTSKDVDKMINNQFDLTLYTCTNDGLNRVTVRCNRINEEI